MAKEKVEKYSKKTPKQAKRKNGKPPNNTNSPGQGLRMPKKYAPPPATPL